MPRLRLHGGDSPRSTAYDRQKMESVIRNGVRFGFCTTNQAPPLAELDAAADETLIENILHNAPHVLHELLPDRTQQLSLKKTWLFTYRKTSNYC